MICSQAKKSDGVSRVSLYRYIPLVLVVCAGVISSILLFITVRNWEQKRMEADFKQAAKDRVSVLKEHIEESLRAIEWIAGFYRGSQKVERDEFREFVRCHLQYWPDVQALEWIPRVPDSQRQAYEATAREDGFTDFHITERKAQGHMVIAGQRKEYFPVYYVEPYKGNEIALGFDLASNPTRLEALNLSRDTGELVATARITLVQETSDQFGFTAFKPVYHKGAPINSVEDRRKNLKGFALGVFRIGDTLKQALTYFEPYGIQIQLCDISAPRGERFLGFYSPPLYKQPASPLTEQEVEQLTSLHHTATLDVGGRKWSVLCMAAPCLLAEGKSWQSLAVLVCGLGFTSLLAVYILFILKHTAEILSSKQQMQKEKDKAQNYLDIAEVLLVAVDAEQKITLINRKGCEILGYQQEDELIGSNWFDICLPEKARDKTKAAFTKLMAGEIDPVKYFESPVMAKSGDEKIISWHSTILRNESDTIIGTLGSGEDITEHSLAQSRLRQHLKQLNCFYGLSKLIERPRISLEQMFQETVNLIRDAYQHPDVTCVRITFDGIHYKTDNFGKTELSQHAHIKVHGNKTGTIEVYYLGEKAENGQDPFLKEDRNLLDVVAERLGKIAERKQTGEKLQLFRNLIDRSNDRIFVMEPKWGRFLDVNDRACACLGYTREELLNMSIKDIDELIPDDSSWQKQTEELKLKGDIVVEGRHKRKCGTVFYVETSLKYVSQGKENYIIAVARDITERKQAEEHQAQLLKEVENTNRELKDFAYIVSHDLKAPLRGIKTLADWMSTDYADKFDEQGRERIDLLSARVDRMHNLIDGVLQYSRAARVKDKKGQVDFNKLVPEVIDMVAPPENIAITVENELPVIECGQTRAIQVFQNLLSNAVKYMDKPQGQIRIGCAGEDGFWKFSVADNGPGIEEKDFERIFQIFQTLLSTRDKFESTGVGLTVVKKIVELYGGRIWVESKPGQGSTFFFTLPKQENEVADNAKLGTNTTG